MRTKVLTKLQQEAEEKYQKFSAKLVPSNIKLLGVRIPKLRQLAKQMLKENEAEEYLRLSVEKFEYQEETMLYSLLLAQNKDAHKIERIKNFVPHINSWAVCDIFCSCLKDAKKQQQIYWDSFKVYTQSSKEYEIRFFYVLALSYFINDEYLEKTFSLIQQQKYVGFYDKMAVAWLLSMMYVKYPENTEKFLLNTPLDEFVFRKSISKICDSYQVTKEAKIHLRTLASKKAIKNN